MKLGAGTAFESVARHYERRELPHTLPCRKLVSDIELYRSQYLKSGASTALPSVYALHLNIIRKNSTHSTDSFIKVKNYFHPFWVALRPEDTLPADFPFTHSPRLTQTESSLFLLLCLLTSSSSTFTVLPFFNVCIILAARLGAPGVHRRSAFPNQCADLMYCKEQDLLYRYIYTCREKSEEK